MKGTAVRAPSAGSRLDEATLAGSAVRWGLDPARFEPPQPRPTDVPRVALLDRVCDPGYRLLSVVAPMGYGKTRLVVQAVRRDARPTAWLTLGRDCNDPVVLARYLGVALEPLCSIGAELRRELDSAHARPPILSAGLAEAVKRGPAGLVVVFDDLQELSPAGAEMVHIVVDNAPPGARVVLVGTRAAPFLGTERARGGIREVGRDDLAFAVEETLELLQRAGSGDLEAIDVPSVRDRTEGWAAGLYLAALALRGGRDLGEDVDEPLGSGVRFVRDFLRETVLAHLPSDQVDFLIRTSLLEVLSGPLCNAVLETDDAAARLARLDDENLFVVPLDDRGERYRYHGLFRECLVHELSCRAPELMPSIHARASEWCEENGSPDRAFRHAAAASDVDRCAALLARYGQHLYVTGRVRLLGEWFEWFESHASIEDYPEVATRAMWVMIMAGRNVSLERWAAAAARGAAARPMDPHEEGIRMLAEAAICRHGVDAMARDVERARSLLPAESTWWPAAWILVGMASLLREDLDEAVAGFRRAIEYAEELQSDAAHLIALAELGICSLRRGDLAAAAASAARAREVMSSGGLEGYPLASLSLAVAARISLLQGDLERAERSRGEADALRAGLTAAFPILAMQVRLELARCAIGLGDVRDARTYLAEADELVRIRPGMGALVDDLGAIASELEARLASGPLVRSLTPAETRLLPLLATHLSFKGIGEQLFVSPHTVKTEAISVYRKLGVTSRAAAVDAARRLGLLAP